MYLTPRLIPLLGDPLHKNKIQYIGYTMKTMTYKLAITTLLLQSYYKIDKMLI